MSIKQGEHTYIGLPINEYFGPHVTIGKFCSIAEDVLWCGSMNHPSVINKKMVCNFNFSTQWKIGDFGGGYARGHILVGNDVWIGKGAIIFDGVTIGDGAIIGMNTMVTKDVPPYAVMVGNPGIVKHFRFTENQIQKLLKIRWWEWLDETIQERVKDFEDISIFLKKYYENT